MSTNSTEKSASWKTKLTHFIKSGKFSNGQASNSKRTTRARTHPELKIPIKFAFTQDGKDIYTFTDDLEMPEMRIRYAVRFCEEMNRKCDTDYLKQLCDKGEELLNEGKLVKVGELLSDLKYRLTWAFEPETLYRYASVLYFPLDENLEGYDLDYNTKKIEEVLKKKGLKYFLETLDDELKKLLDQSEEDLQTYIEELKNQNSKQQKRLNLKS